jgi:putative oxidoreductase
MTYPAFRDSGGLLDLYAGARGTYLQRLYSMFPNAWPGKGLLLLRLTAGGLLIHDGFSGLSGHGPLVIIVRQFIEVITGLLLLAGFLTPVAGILIFLVQLWIIFLGAEYLPMAIALATWGAALAMLGPGAISVDSILFGRRRIDIGNR